MGLSLGPKIILASCASLSILILIGYASHELTPHYAYGKVSPSQSASGPYLNDPNLRAEVIFRGLDFPSSMAFLGKNDILVLEKNEGTVRRIVNGTMLESPLLKVNVSKVGERGMLGIAVAKDNNTISKPSYVFLYYTEVAEEDPNKDVVDRKVAEFPARNRLYRYELVGDKLVNPKLLLELPVSTRYIHNGGSISIGTDGNVYLAVGDLNGENPQDSQLPNGRAGILRIDQDGNVVKNNVSEYVLGSTHPINKYFAFGIRNSFGMDFDPVTGYLWDTENGPGFGDEINLVGPGFNSGWREIQGFWNERDENTTVLYPDNLLDFRGKSYYSHPELAFFPSVGLTGLSFLDSDRYGTYYKNNLFVGDFHNGFLYHFKLSKERNGLDLPGTLEDGIAEDTHVLKEIIFGQGFGGIIDIEVGPDGYLYILSLYKGGDNCLGILPEDEIANLSEQKNCINYNSEIQGTMFKIVPATEK
jgi:aldose sugar dehydrogenase